MRNRLLNKLFVVLSSGALMFGTPAAYAATTSTSLVNSGDRVEIEATSNQSSSVNVNNTNVATVDQNVNANSNSGFNSASKNIGGGTVNTGTASVGVGMEVNANRNTTYVGGTNPGNTNLTDIVNTGDRADIDTSTNTSSSVDVTNTNSAYVSQSCGGGLTMLESLTGGYQDGCNANSGFNDADSNIGGGSVTSGTAAVGVDFKTNVNKNATVVGGANATNGVGLLNGTSITNTGDDAEVENTANASTSVDVNSFNEAYISQLLRANSNSGFNDADSNIGGGSVVSGLASVGAGMLVNANSNATGVSGGYGLEPVSANLNDIVNTGDDLLSETSVNSASSATVNNLGSLLAQQYAYEHSNSGKNDTNSNIGGGFVGTHVANVGTAFSAAANANTTILGGLLNSLLSFLLL